MFRRLRAWWDAPLFSMPHRANEHQIPIFTHVDCQPNTIYFMNGPVPGSEFSGWY